MLNLVDDPEHRGFPGWTSYVDRFGDAPDVEVMCGGINTKTPSAAAIWRQGNLLHFGFQEHPGQLNATGRALLENAIHYIVRFQKDRPIAISPSVFVTRKSIPRRARTLKDLKTPGYNLEWIRRRLPEAEQKQLDAMGQEKYAGRFEKMMTRMGLGPDGKLAIDADLVALDVGNDDLAMIARAIEALSDDASRDRGRRLLSRYVPCGPDPAANASVWTAWLEAHRPYLFFSESGQYRWYLDGLAKERGVPSTELRGPRRAERKR